MTKWPFFFNSISNIMFIFLFFGIIILLTLSIIGLIRKKIIQGSSEPSDNLGYYQNHLKLLTRVLEENCPNRINFSDIPDTGVQYAQKVPSLNNIIHVGQLKLFLSEVQFLTQTQKNLDEPGFFLYIGSGPGIHLGSLLELFPRIKFILFDPSQHKIKPSPEIDSKIVYFGNYDPGENPDPKENPDLKEMVNYFNSDTEKVEKISKTQINFTGIMNWNKIFKFIQTDKVFSFYIYENLFTELIAEKIKKNKFQNLLFCSDIRTIENSEPVSNLNVIYNLAQQFIFTKIIQPKYSLLKFRTNYLKGTEETLGPLKLIHKKTFQKAKKLGIDFLENYENQQFEYFSGNIYLQAFNGSHSTETRLFLEQDPEIKFYSLKNYEDNLFYYNRFERCFGFHTNLVEDQEMGIDHCGDCSLMWIILNQYFEKFKPEIGDKKSEIKKIIKNILNILGRKLKPENSAEKYIYGGNHGLFFKHYDLDYLEKNLKIYKYYNND